MLESLMNRESRLPSARGGSWELALVEARKTAQHNTFMDTEDLRS